MAERKTDAQAAKTQAQAPAKTENKRRAWTPKTPVEVVLEQIAKQEKRVSDLRDDLKKEEANLTRLQQAKRVLEAS